ncbi:MAG TPA: GntR family transcriptional regulator [Acidimicrobiales bacterium]|nr:GntR family transcriptional regulator [Acidimicrobiales bacterium]
MTVYTPVHTASAVAYQELKSWILMGEVPVGVRLREERIADRIGVSRTPVREAMLRLHAERFLERHVEGGYRVAVLSSTVVSELYEVRRALELFALNRATDSGAAYDRDLLEQLRRDWTSVDADVDIPDPEFVLLDEEFHGTLAEAAGNHELADELRRVNERIRPVRSHDFVTPGRIAATIDEHLDILSAVLDGLEGKASLLLDRHIRESQAIAQQASSLALERMLLAGTGKGAEYW